MRVSYDVRPTLALPFNDLPRVLGDWQACDCDPAFAFAEVFANRETSTDTVIRCHACGAEYAIREVLNAIADRFVALVRLHGVTIADEPIPYSVVPVTDSADDGSDARAIDVPASDEIERGRNRAGAL